MHELFKPPAASFWIDSFLGTIMGMVDRIARSARACQAEVLITTHKDFVKIEANHSWPVELMAVDVEIQLIDHEQQFLSILTNVLN